MPLSTTEKASALARLPLFAGIGDESLNRLAEAAGEQEFAPGQFIVLQGQVGTGLFVIVHGNVRVVRGSDELTTLGPGEFFGELSVIDQEPRYASVQAIDPTTCLAVASWDLMSLLQADPALSLNLIRGLVARVRAAGEQHRH
jgi:CRP/FNR family transcriptional regulator, cyclic AMP receptor protein